MSALVAQAFAKALAEAKAEAKAAASVARRIPVVVYHPQPYTDSDCEEEEVFG